MTGNLWILSYVILFIGMLAALATSLAVARQIGRVVISEDRGHRDNSDAGLAPGVPFPPLELETIQGTIVRPHRWKSGLLLQIAVTSDFDVRQTLQFEAEAPSTFAATVLVSAIGPPDYLEEIQRKSSHLSVYADGHHQVAASIRTTLRPYALFIREGQVASACTFAAIDDLQTLVNAFIARQSEAKQTSTPESSTSQREPVHGLDGGPS